MIQPQVFLYSPRTGCPFYWVEKSSWRESQQITTAHLFVIKSNATRDSKVVLHILLIILKEQYQCSFLRPLVVFPLL